eukprot:NODE_343_length_1757_cov_234.378806_g278_i0.p1 GENE.NODE_343_length_1757_cov_234.378806_g278_i0~~NODE_343_length_1757_cov_234.378806_g278_i0.p1  ORF type:complete len:521 (-),score=132.85 NODE_343_length_1757_cov_234.378806_g278_i0:114-1676(-)
MFRRLLPAAAAAVGPRPFTSSSFFSMPPLHPHSRCCHFQHAFYTTTTATTNATTATIAAATAAAVPSPRIAIVGAGLAGPCLAGILAHMPAPPSVIDVFERDHKDRDQGCGIALDTMGLQMIERAGVAAEYASLFRPGSDAYRIFLQGHPKPLWVTHTGSTEVNRELLRNALLARLPDWVKVRFDCGVEGIREGTKKGKATTTGAKEEKDAGGSGSLGSAVLLGTGGVELGEYDLVVDASGCHSSLRRFRLMSGNGGNGSDAPAEELFNGAHYLDSQWIYGIIDNPEHSVGSQLVDIVGGGTMVYLQNPLTRMLSFQRYGAAFEDKRTTMVYMLPRQDGPYGLSKEIGVPPSQFLTEECDLRKVQDWMHADMGNQWDAPFHQAVDALAKVSVRPVFQHPASPPFDQNSSLPLVLLGDALHTMIAAGGREAMRDVMLLSEYISSALEEEGLTLKGLRAVEKTMMTRAAENMLLDTNGQPIKEFIINDSPTARGRLFLGTLGVLADAGVMEKVIGLKERLGF